MSMGQGGVTEVLTSLIALHKSETRLGGTRLGGTGFASAGLTAGDEGWAVPISRKAIQATLVPTLRVATALCHAPRAARTVDCDTGRRR